MLTMKNKFSHFSCCATIVLFTFLFVFVNPLKSQTKKVMVHLDWKDSENFGFNFLVPQQGSSNESGVPYYSITIPLGQQEGIKDVSVNLIKTLPSSPNKWSQISKDALPNDFTVTFSTKTSQKKNYAIISIMAAKKTGNTISLLEDFELEIIKKQGVSSFSTKSNLFASNSVLRSGTGQWYKISVPSKGMYKIDKAFLETIGIDVTNLNPQHINIYGNGFGMLPVDNSQYRPDDLLKNAIIVQGESDGAFNDNDYVLFYARGPHIWERESTRFKHIYNIYDEKSYYYININSNEPPKRVTALSSLGTASNQTAGYSDARVFHESDLENLTKSGKNWYGEKFDIQLQQTFDISTPNPISGSQAEIKIQAAIKKYNGSTVMNASVGGTSLGSLTPSNSGTYDEARVSTQTFSFPISGNTQSVNLNFNRGSASELAWLDYIEINFRQQLRLNNGVLFFRNFSTTGAGNITDFSIANSNSNTRIWDVSDPSNSFQINGSLSGNSYSIRVATDSLREFAAFNTNQLLTPTFEEVIVPQNLHALSQVDYVIVSHSEFLSQAQRLGDLHRNFNDLDVHVIEDTKIYNEFSCGLKDPTAIKWFMKMFYERSNSNGSKSPKYLLLFGDGSYDPKDRLSDNTHFLPTYHNENGVSLTASFVADDYFALLDDGESAAPSDLLDIGIGRFPVTTAEEAKVAVDKVEHYMKNGSPLFINNNNVCDEDNPTSTFGDWRNKLTLIADDEDNGVFVRDCKDIADTIKNYRREMNNKFIMLDAFQQISTSGGQRYPSVVEEINQSITRGTLLMNYVGHGGEVGLAQERIITVPQIQAWNNINKLTVLVSATCEFSRYDDPGRVSAGEYAFLNDQGGAICLFTTTRLVLISINSQVNISFAKNVFKKENGEPLAFGEIMRRTKNLNANSTSNNYRNFTLLGDPALKIAIPRKTAFADELNNIVITSGLQDTLKALSKITFSGYVADINGQKITNYNGILNPTVFDKISEEKTLGQDSGSPIIDFEQWVNTIYKGKATVKNGDFEFSFVVPKDINLSYGNGRLSLYANDGDKDNHGYNESFIVGGFDTTAADDNIGPEIELFMNDENFVHGGMTDENPVIVAKFFDESGINTVGNGIGHDITAIIDGNTSEPLNLNDFYEADLDTYKSGSVRFPLSKMEPGPHKISLKAWDVYNNSTDAELEFVVAESQEIALDHVLNYPNPFTTKTQFFFEHNQACHFLDTQIQIFTVSGKLVKTINRQVRTNGFRVEGIEWDGRDDFGDKIGRGVYVYRVSVYTPDGETAEAFEKLVILN